MRYATWCFDYVYFWWVYYSLDMFIGHDNWFKQEAFLPVHVATDSFGDILIALILVVSAFTVVFNGLIVREYILCFIFQDKVAKIKIEKLKHVLTDMTLAYWVTLTLIPGMTFFTLGTILEVLYWDEILLDWNSYYSVVVEYHLMLLLKDFISFRFIHAYVMHGFNKPPLNLWHQVHHTYKEETITPTAAVMHPVDLFFETFVGCFTLLFLKFCVLSAYHGHVVTPQVHFAAFLFMLTTDLNLHSGNPYSVIYFNPIFDWVFLSNLAHNLHHIPLAKRKEFGVMWDTPIPWRHANPWSGSRARDVRLYNEVFGTNFNFEDDPVSCLFKSTTKHKAEEGPESNQQKIQVGKEEVNAVKLEI